MEEFNNDALHTSLACIQSAVRRDGVPITTLIQMLAQLPASVRGPFAATRETVELVVSRFPTAFFIDSYDNVYVRSKDCQASTGASKKYTLSANKKMNTITRFHDVKGCMTKVMSGYGFATMEHPVKSLVFVHKMFVEHGRPDDPNRLGLLVGDVIIMDVEENGSCPTVRFNAARVRLLEAVPQPAHNLRPTTAVPHANNIHSDAAHVRHLEGGTWPAHSSPPTMAVPYTNNKEQLLNQVGVIHSLDREGGVISFGSEGTEQAFFSKASVPKTLLKATKMMHEVFSVGDKVCLDVQRNRNPRRQGKWQATMVTTVEHDSHSVVFEDYTTPPKSAVKSRNPETSRKPTATSFEVSGVREESRISAQQHFPSKQEKCHAAVANTAQHNGSSNVYSVPTGTTAPMEEKKKKKMHCTNARKKCTRGRLTLDQCVSVAFSRHRKLSSYGGTLHADSETLGHVKCHCNGTIALVLIDVVYSHGRKVEHFGELSEKPTSEEDTNVFVDAVEVEHDFWLATLVWSGERPMKPHVNRSEDIFSSVLESVSNGELAKGVGLATLKYCLDACQRCHSTSAYGAIYTGSLNESSIQTAGQRRTVGQVQEPSDCPPTAYPASDKDGIVHSDIEFPGWKPNAAIQPDRGGLPEEADITAIDKTIHPALVNIAAPCTAATSDMMAFQASICADFVDTSAEQPTACSNMRKTMQTAASSLCEDNTNDVCSGGDAEL
ncbi:uncharacterized protein LOC119378974 [Rhipicephalus sanguineus]|uniref:uncharacterized protein LOC119378974 n=1 Tax=Rhipicephalus sanguineus TaxID=34632 RepID=UPI0018957BD9|nr:uncharacterized protein LOC119378974 [Rhipicephalus sanguineus]